MIQREVPEERWLKTEKYLNMYDSRSYECLSHHVLKSYDILLSNYSILTCRLLEFAVIIQQISAFVLLLQFISSPSLLHFRNEEGEGRGEIKAKKHIWKMHSVINQI